MRFETLAISSEREPDAMTGAVSTPTYQALSFVFKDVRMTEGYDYSRTANPTRKAVKDCTAALEGAEAFDKYGDIFETFDSTMGKLTHAAGPLAGFGENAPQQAARVNGWWGGWERLQALQNGSERRRCENSRHRHPTACCGQVQLRENW